MAGQIRHLVERGGRYWSRVVVPDDVRLVIGKTEIREALGGDRRIAERNVHAAVARALAAIEAARLATGQTSPGTAGPRAVLLSPDALAAIHYQDSVALDAQLRDVQPAYSAISIDDGYVADLRRATSGAASDGELQTTIGHLVDTFRRRGNTSAAHGSIEWRTLARKLAAAELEALRRMAERDEGDLTGKPADAALGAPPPSTTAEPVVSIDGLFKAYIGELKRSGRGEEAERRWAPVFKNLRLHLGHDDARLLTKTVLANWKDELLQTLAPKTVKDVYLGAVKAVLGWAEDNGRLEANPAARVTVRVAKPIQGREKGLTDEEARAVLAAALAYQPKPSDNPRTREGAHLAAAKRWVPWLCALTGARVAEITQLRKEDVQERDGVAFVRLTPDAGSIKTGQYRDVPLHPQLIELGFLEFVRASKAGPLFYDGATKRAASAKPARHVAGRVSDWVRGLKVVGADVDPNHAWRHRLKTIARELGLDPRVVDAIQGHAARTAGENYGDVTLKAKAMVIEQFPKFQVTGK